MHIKTKYAKREMERYKTGKDKRNGEMKGCKIQVLRTKNVKANRSAFALLLP